ncbi:MAG: pyruvate formate lyase family protein [Treponema sp.]|jgi:pyruvate-formate lyase|nr:pyruvate formate lyase family protein [Treponema sp.]
MARFNVETPQNVEISQKIPCEKPLLTQLEIMEEYTAVHREAAGKSRSVREIECLRVLYPRLFRGMEAGDRIAGRLDFLPVGFGCVTSVGGVGHYCVFAKLRAFQKQLPEAERGRVDALYDYWLEHDLKTLYCREALREPVVGPFVDCEYPLIVTARLSGMMLDYQKLLDLGIGGLRAEIERAMAAGPGTGGAGTEGKSSPDRDFYRAGLACLDLFETCALYLADQTREEMGRCGDLRWIRELEAIRDALLHIKEGRPRTFLEALQLFWLYALLAGVINYGRLDDCLGPYLARDLAAGTLTEDDAFDILKSLWTMIENRRTTVNGRIVVGGRGRRHPAEADVFARLALKVAGACRYVEPQFTLRFDQDTPEDIWDAAMDALGSGATYPTLYNDAVNVPAVQYGMRLDEKTAAWYVPFGCTEFVIQGQSTGTPNVCMNLLKMLTITLNGGIDPMDGKAKNGTVQIPPAEAFKSFDEFYGTYKELLDYYMDIAIEAQLHSYKVMNEEVSFLFTSLLMDDCIGRGRALLDGGVRYLGGTNETYGNINASDSLWAIRDLVFDQGRYTLTELRQAALANFEGCEHIRRDLWNCDKYGNDLDTADGMAVDLYNYVAQGVRDRGIKAGMQYYLIVISNNQVNTEWGRRTAASPDGRYAGQYMNPANNPQGGADHSGPTAMLNSLTRFDPRYHAGSVQNIKFTPRMFRENRPVINALFKTYFRRGGCHLMVTVVDRGVLEDAAAHPEKYPNLLVRVSGFSAVFVRLAPDIQQEVMSRVLYDSEPLP